jgi:hypothetical protein
MAAWRALSSALLRPTPQGAAIGLLAPQTQVQVRLLWSGHDIDVTGNSAIAALRPLTLRIGLPFDGGALNAASSGELHFIDLERDTRIGRLRLRHLRDWASADAVLGLHQVVGGSHLCASALRRHWDSVLYRRAARRVPAERQLMRPRDVELSMVFYSCPRPVFFVGVDDGTRSNLFPMDLVGPQHPGLFTLALRNTSPSVETIRNSRRLALGDVPAEQAALAYRLGRHHKTPMTDWSALPVGSLTTARFGLRLPEVSLRVRELQILDHLLVGSHTLFLARICSDRTLQSGPQLFHTSGAYQALRGRQGRAFAAIAGGGPV